MKYHFVENNEEEIKWIRKNKTRERKQSDQNEGSRPKNEDGKETREVINRILSYYMSNRKQYT